jgi:hypothetical protein
MLVVCIFASALGALIMCLLVLRDGFAPTNSESGPTDRDVLITRLGHAAAGVCFATTAIVATVLLARTPAPRPMAATAPELSVRLAAVDRDRERLGEQIRVLGSAVQTLRDEVGVMGGGVQGVRARLDAAESRVAQAEAAVAKAEAAVAKTDAALKRVAEDVEKAARVRYVERPAPARPATAAVRETTVPAPPAREIAAAPPARRPSTEVERSHDSARTPATETAPAPVAPSPAPVATTPPKPAPAAALAPAAAAASAPKPAAPPKAVAAPKTPPAPQESETGITDKVRKDWDTIRKGFTTAGDDITSGFRQLGRKLTGRD